MHWNPLPGLCDLSIQSKLIALLMAAITVSLGLAMGVFVLVELSAFRDSLRRQMETTARFLSESAAVALAFDDSKRASDSLGALRADSLVEAAGLYRPNGRSMAAYHLPGAGRPASRAALRNEVIFSGNHLELYRLVLLDREQVGMVYLRARLRTFPQLLSRFSAIAALVFVPSLAAGLMVCSRLQRIISGPILETLASRDQELIRAQTELEQRVQQRTAELQAEIAGRKSVEMDLVAAKDLAEESNRAKTSFLANMSHELRTPLNAIIGYSEMLEEDAEAEGKQAAITDLRKIHSAGRHLLALINDVLDISKIEAGRMDVKLEEFETAQLIRDVIHTVAPIARKHRNRLEVRGGNAPETMTADLRRFRQSLLNLLSNACKFTEEGAVSLEVELAEYDGRQWICWIVTDTGIGIPPEKMKNLFQAFYQADSTSTRKYEGTGLGLAISKRLCEMMGGDITATSSPGKGSTFTIHMPAHAPAHRRAVAEQEALCD